MQSHLKRLLPALYTTRYTGIAQSTKDAIWGVLCRHFLQRFVPSGSTVLDIGCGHCEFINTIKAFKKYAIDIDPRVKQYAHQDVTVFVQDAHRLPRKLHNSIDVVFMGCVLEHLPSKDAIIVLLGEIKRVLRPGGRLLILNPNIRFTTSEYWDYFDHLTPVSDRSMVEVLEALGFDIEVCLPRFVPNTLKDALPKSPLLVRLYLALPFLFPIFGKQMFIAAKNP